MKKIILALGLIGISAFGVGFGTRAGAGVVSKEEVLFMEIPEVVPPRPALDLDFIRHPPVSSKGSAEMKSRSPK
jgi:hypothetical protein